MRTPPFPFGNVIAGYIVDTIASGIAGSPSGGPNPIVSNGLVGWWPFDANDVNFTTATATDLSATRNNGALTALSAPLPLTFNGVNSSVVPPANAAYSLASFTYACWVNFSSLPGGFVAIAEHNRFGNNWVYLGKSGSGNFGVWRATFFDSNDGITTFSTGTNSFLVGTYDATTTRAIYYLNGVADLSYTATAPTPTLDLISIGLNQGFGECLSGTMPAPGTKVYNRALTSAEVSTLYKANSGRGPVNVIWDDDYAGDVDGVSAHYILLALAQAGYANIIGMVADSMNIYSAPAMEAVNITMGQGSIPVGAYQGSSTGDSTSLWAQGVSQRFGTNGKTRANYTEAVAFLRQTLVNSSGNVVYICSGYETTLALLLQSPADSISPLTGAQLVTAKVTKFVIMGGDYPTGTGENNFAGDPTSAAFVFNNTPISIFGLGASLGAPISILPAPNSSALTDPFTYALQLNGTGNTAAFDPMAVHYGVLGLSQYYSVTGSSGTNTINTANGNNSWAATAGKSSYLGKVTSDGGLTTIYQAIVTSMSR